MDEDDSWPFFLAECVVGATLVCFCVVAMIAMIVCLCRFILNA